MKMSSGSLVRAQEMGTQGETDKSCVRISLKSRELSCGALSRLIMKFGHICGYCQQSEQLDRERLLDKASISVKLSLGQETSRI